MVSLIERYSAAWNDFNLRLDDAFVDRYEFNESQHPRYDAGAPGSVGGQFRPTGSSGGGNRPGGALPAHQLKAAQAKGGAAWDAAMNEGRTAAFDSTHPTGARQVNAPANRVASQVMSGWHKSQHVVANPKANTAQRINAPEKPGASVKRELAELPKIAENHPLHHGQLPRQLQAKVLDWNYRMSKLTGVINMYGSQAAPGMRGEAEEAGWAKVDKNAVRAMLQEMNQMDVEARSAGIPLSDFVNANGLIPRSLAVRLDGGARFF